MSSFSAGAMTLMGSEQVKSAIYLRPGKLTFRNEDTEVLMKINNYQEETTNNSFNCHHNDCTERKSSK